MKGSAEAISKSQLLSMVRYARNPTKKILWRRIRGESFKSIAEGFETTEELIKDIVLRYAGGDIDFQPYIQEVSSPEPVKVTRKRHYTLKTDGTMTEVDDYSRVMMLSVRGFKPREIVKMTGLPIERVYKYRHKIRHGKR